MFKTVFLLSILAAAALSTGCASAPQSHNVPPSKRLSFDEKLCKRFNNCGYIEVQGRPAAIVEAELSQVRERVAAEQAE